MPDFESTNDLGEVDILSFTIRFMPLGYFDFVKFLNVKAPHQVEKSLNLESKDLSSRSKFCYQCDLRQIMSFSWLHFPYLFNEGTT